jgi:hypothetical protein
MASCRGMPALPVQVLSDSAPAAAVGVGNRLIGLGRMVAHLPLPSSLICTPRDRQFPLLTCQIRPTGSTSHHSTREAEQRWPHPCPT